MAKLWIFILAYVMAAGANDEAGIKDNKKYFLPRGEHLNSSLVQSFNKFMIFCVSILHDTHRIL